MWIFISTWLLSIIDRAGIPVVMVVAISVTEFSIIQKYVLVIGCIVAGTIGDTACFCVGRLITGQHHRDTSIFSERNLFSRLQGISKFIDGHTTAWLVLCRVFPAVNQFVPMAAAIRGISIYRVIYLSFIGNIIWFSSFALMADSFVGIAKDGSRAVQLVAGIVGILILFVSYRANAKMEEVTLRPDRTEEE